MTQSSPSSGDGQKRPAGLLRILGVLDRGLGVIERTIVAGSVLVMAALMSAHVVGNLLFGSGIAGTYEVTEMLIVVITFVGVGYAARHARHISMSAIYDQLGGRWRKALLILICLGTAVLMFYFAYKSIDYVIVIAGARARQRLVGHSAVDCLSRAACRLHPGRCPVPADHCAQSRER